MKSYDAFIIEQTILADFGRFRVYLDWSKELFNKDIYQDIKHYFLESL